MDAAAVAQQALAEKVATLERQGTALQDELERARATTLGAMLGPLRLRQIVLLYIGTEDTVQFVENLSRDFGSWAVNQAIRHLFVLNNAPGTNEQREQFRAMFDNGLTKF